MQVEIYNDILARTLNKIGKKEQSRTSNSANFVDHSSILDTFITDAILPNKSLGSTSAHQTNSQFEVSFGDDKMTFDLSKPNDRDRYADQLLKDFSEKLKDAKNPNDMKKLFDEIGERIINDINSKEVKPNVSSDKDSQKDLDQAIKILDDVAEKEFENLKAKAQQAQDNANSTGSGGGEESALDELERQARIQKWETLKDISLVNYLKATLAGIKASQKLAASAQ